MRPARVLLVSAILTTALICAGGLAGAASVSTGDGLTLTLTAGGSVSSLQIDGDELAGGTAAAFWVRQLTSPTPDPGSNLVPNGSFEDGVAGGLPVHWSIYRESGTVKQVVSDQAADGTYSFFIETDPSTNANGSAAYLSDPISIASGTVYRFSAQVLARKGYLAQTQQPIEWQRDIWSSLQMGGGIYVAWFDNPAGQGTPLDAVLVAATYTNAHNWRRISGEARAPAGAASARVIVAAVLRDKNQQDDALWIDGVSMFESPDTDVPAVGTLSQSGPDLLFSGDVGSTGLRVEATFAAAAGRIEITGRVIDTLPQPNGRALELSLRFPLALAGYRWWDDTVTARTIVSGQSYANQVSAVVNGMLPQSLYPLAAAEDGSHGIALAMPLDPPEVALLSYTRGGQIEARFALGISPVATRLGNAASFAATLYRFDAPWAFRAALAKLASFHPEWFQPDPVVYDYESFAKGHFQGGAGGCNPDCNLTCEECCTGAYIVACHDDRDIATAQHTATDAYMITGSSNYPPVSYDEAIAQLSNPPNPNDTDRYRAIQVSLVQDANGDYVLKKMATEENWAPGAWLHVWVPNLDPELTDPVLGGGLAQWLRQNLIEPALANTTSIGAVLDGVMFDNFMSVPALDMNTDHFPYADETLTYDPNTLVPAIHTMSATREYLSWVRSYLDANYPDPPRGFSCNTKGVGTVHFFAPWIMVFGGEGNIHGAQGDGGAIWDPAVRRYRRAIAYDKPVTMANAADLDAGGMRVYTDEALALGIYPGLKDEAVLARDAEDIYADAIEALLRYWHLGWEPVTYATADQQNLTLERFGQSMGALLDTVYFTVHESAGAAASYSVTIESSALGVADPPVLVVKDARTADTLDYTSTTGTITVAGSIEASGTSVIRLMAAGCKPTLLKSASITFKPEAANDRARLRGSFDDPGTTPDFLSSDVTFRLADRDGEVWQAVVPAGSFTTTNGKTFKFRDKTGTVANGLIRAAFWRHENGIWKWKAKLKGTDLDALDRLHIDVFIEVGATSCWADMRNCKSKRKGKRLRCRP